jgi:hypothetical protein
MTQRNFGQLEVVCLALLEIPKRLERHRGGQDRVDTDFEIAPLFSRRPG